MCAVSRGSNWLKNHPAMFSFYNRISMLTVVSTPSTVHQQKLLMGFLVKLGSWVFLIVVHDPCRDDFCPLLPIVGIRTIVGLKGNY